MGSSGLVRKGVRSNGTAVMNDVTAADLFDIANIIVAQGS
jgi:hypothetical protein